MALNIFLEFFLFLEFTWFISGRLFLLSVRRSIHDMSKRSTLPELLFSIFPVICHNLWTSWYWINSWTKWLTLSWASQNVNMLLRITCVVSEIRCSGSPSIRQMSSSKAKLYIRILKQINWTHQNVLYIYLWWLIIKWYVT